MPDKGREGIAVGVLVAIAVLVGFGVLVGIGVTVGIADGGGVGVGIEGSASKSKISELEISSLEK